MLFNTALFAVYFVVFFALYHIVLTKHSHRIWLLLLGSLLFYAGFSFSFLPYLLATGFMDYAVAKAIDRTDDERRKRLLCSISVAVNLGVLGYFKYANFFLTSWGGLLSAVGHPLPAQTLKIVVPVGISFYTFQSISYVVDVTRGIFPAHKKYREFLASLAFFPHLVAGPIVRTSQFLPQFEKLVPPDTEKLLGGAILIGTGLIKKTIADLLAPTSDALFHPGALVSGWASWSGSANTSGQLSALEAWTGVLAFAGQLYGDFSGYTDIAIGVAALLGFTLPKNFDLPYFAFSPVDFWRRWHISLSLWLKDYLYMPLALRWRGSVAAPLVITWLLGGLWHGASWTFVVWGLYYGVVLYTTHLLAARVPVSWCGGATFVPLRVAKVALTFYLVLIGWTLFRAPTFERAYTVLRAMHAPEVASEFTFARCLTLLLVLLGLVLPHVTDAALRDVQFRQRRILFPSVVTLSLVFAILFGRVDQTFIYFAF